MVREGACYLYFNLSGINRGATSFNLWETQPSHQFLSTFPTPPITFPRMVDEFSGGGLNKAPVLMLP